MRLLQQALELQCVDQNIAIPRRRFGAHARDPALLVNGLVLLVAAGGGVRDRQGLTFCSYRFSDSFESRKINWGVLFDRLGRSVQPTELRRSFLSCAQTISVT
jgi:hypothetical protein